MIMGTLKETGYHVNFFISAEQKTRIKEWAKAHHQTSLLSGVTWSAALRYLIDKGLETENGNKKKE